jgi:hypothetical protein
MSAAYFVAGFVLALSITNALQAYFSRGLKAAYEAHTRALIESSRAHRQLAVSIRMTMAEDAPMSADAAVAEALENLSKAVDP